MYAAALVSVVHFAWLTKADLLARVVHASVLELLFAVRLRVLREVQRRVSAYRAPIQPP